MKMNTATKSCIYPNKVSTPASPKMLGHLELSIAGAPMSYHWASGPTPKKEFYNFFFLTKREREREREIYGT